MRAYAVIDIGGTAIKYGCATEEGQFLEKASRPTRAGAVSIPDAVLAIVKDMAARHELAGIAIDTAGIVRPGEDGEIVYRHSLALPLGERPTLAQGATMVDAAVQAADRFYPAFDFLVRGAKRPQDALDACMFETVGSAWAGATSSSSAAVGWVRRSLRAGSRPARFRPSV